MSSMMQFSKPENLDLLRRVLIVKEIDELTKLREDSNEFNKSHFDLSLECKEARMLLQDAWNNNTKTFDETKLASFNEYFSSNKHSNGFNTFSHFVRNNTTDFISEYYKTKLLNIEEKNNELNNLHKELETTNPSFERISKTFPSNTRDISRIFFKL